MICLLKHDSKAPLEIVVSSQELGMLPDEIIKIMFIKQGMEVDPKKKLYKYGVESTLEIYNIDMQINPGDGYVFIGKEKVYVSGVVDIMLEQGDISIQRYGNVQKFMNKYRQRLEKEHMRKKNQYWEQRNEDKKKDRY